MIKWMQGSWLHLLLLLLQYGQGVFAPGVPYGDAGQYKCGHNLLLAHAKTYDLFHNVPQASRGGKTFAEAQGGKIGIALNIEYLEPLTQVVAGLCNYYIV